MIAANPKDLPQYYFSLDEYFALEHAGDARYEYWNGEIVCMSGGSREHGRISSNVHGQLYLGLRGGQCQTFTAEQPVKTPTLPPYRYPDASVACGELKYENVRGIDVLLNPVVIVEVLSPTSAARDYEDKFTAYQAIQTFSEYLLIAQDTPRVIHYTRQPEGGWERRDVIGLNATLTLTSINCALKLIDVYEGVTFTV
jgi:Uma2 family endonuclease